MSPACSMRGNKKLYNTYVQNSKEENRLGDRIQYSNIKAGRKDVLCSEV